MKFYNKRDFIYERDGGFCQWCGHVLLRRNAIDASSAMTLDHIVPKLAGGSSEPDNLLLCCFPCNNSRARAQGLLAIVLQAKLKSASAEHSRWMRSVGNP